MIIPDKAFSWSWVRLGNFFGVEGVPWPSLTGAEFIGTIGEIVSLFLAIPFRAELDSERFSEKTSFSAWFKLAGILLALYKEKSLYVLAV